MSAPFIKNYSKKNLSPQSGKDYALAPYDISLKKCFEDAKKTKSHVVRFSSLIPKFAHIINTLESCYTKNVNVDVIYLSSKP